VNQEEFGKLFEFVVDGDIYAQPLYLSKADLPRLGKNVVYVATMHNSVYAFDADKADAKPLWKKSLQPAVPLEGNRTFCQNVHDVVEKEIGIIGTPVISTELGAIYVVNFTKASTGYSYFLHALDLNTGVEKFGGPRRIDADGFYGYLQMQRAALLLSDRTVYVAFGSFGDCNDDARHFYFHGWLFGFDPFSLVRLKTVFNTTPGGKTEAGIWQAGQGPAADAAGNIYFMSGNGDFDRDTNQHRWLGNSFVKLTSQLSFMDRFTVWNARELSDSDLDLGSGGPLLIPKTNLLVGGGKEGVLYLLRRDKLGGYSPTRDAEKKNIVQEFQATTERCAQFDPNEWPDPCPDPAPAINSQGGYHHIHGSPVYWDTPDGPFLYLWGEADRLRRYKFDSKAGRFDTEPVLSPAQVVTPTRSMPGATLSLSANAGAARPEDTGIIWATHPAACRRTPACDADQSRKDPTCWCDANVGVVPGTLRAIDASTLDSSGQLKELWSSDNVSTDTLGAVAKFTPVTVANGKVYVATFRNPRDSNSRPALVVYGLKSQAATR